MPLVGFIAITISTVTALFIFPLPRIKECRPYRKKNTGKECHAAMFKTSMREVAVVFFKNLFSPSADLCSYYSYARSNEAQKEGLRQIKLLHQKETIALHVSCALVLAKKFMLVKKTKGVQHG